MPQGDLLGFGPTVLVVGVTFLGGYYLWATWAAPRVGALLRVRAWLASAVLVDPVGGWPEVVVLGVQFGLLVGLLHRGATTAQGDRGGLPPVGWTTPVGPVGPSAGGLHAWAQARPTGGAVWTTWAGLWARLAGGTTPRVLPVPARVGARVERFLSHGGATPGGLH